MSQQFLRISLDAIDQLIPILGETAFTIYVYLGRHARWASTDSKLGSQSIGKGELVRTIEAISAATNVHRSSVHRAMESLQKLGLIETRSLGSTRVVRLTDFSSHFCADFETKPNTDRDETEQQPNTDRTPTETISIYRSISKSRSKNTSTRSPRRVPTLLPLESYKEIIIPDWKIIPANPITLPKHELAPPNAVTGIETPLPIPRGDWLVPKPGTVMSATEVYEAIFWVFPREWDKFTDKGGGFPDDVSDFINLEAWAISKREEFHTSKHYSNHTAWLKARLGTKQHGNYGSRASYN